MTSPLTVGLPPPPGEVVAVGVAVGPGDGATQVGRVMVLLSRLTWPFLANTRPATVAPVCTDAEVNAKMLPTKVVWVPRVAELPTCQKAPDRASQPDHAGRNGRGTGAIRRRRSRGIGSADPLMA
jgi:hypothetical protein